MRHLQRGVAAADRRQHRRYVDGRPGDKVDHLPFLLDIAADQDQAGTEDGALIFLADLFPDDNIGVAGLVLDRHEDHAIGRPRPLADIDHAGNLDIALVLRGHGYPAGDDAALGQVLAQESDRMGAVAEPDLVIILDHFGAVGHALEGDAGRIDFRKAATGLVEEAVEQRQGFVAQHLDGVQRVAPGDFEGGLEGIGPGELAKGGHRRPRPAPQIWDRPIRNVTAAEDHCCDFLATDALDQAETQADGKPARPVGRLKRAVPAGVVDAEPSDLDAV